MKEDIIEIHDTQPIASSSDRRQRQKQKQKQLLANIIQSELTELQRDTFVAYHMEHKPIVQIARERGVNKSTVSRTLARAEQKIARITRYLQNY